MARPHRHPADSDESDLLALGRELTRLRRRCRRFRRDDWKSWSAVVQETNALARRISRIQPRNLADLAVRYDALHWLMLEQDDVIMDANARRQFIAFGRALVRMVRRAG